VLVVLAMVRHLLTMAETRRLYSKVERAAEDRRALLTEVLARADADRHRVAAQLHEQAVGAYASFVAATGGREDAEGSKPIRDDLARQAESLRRLMMAIQPIEPTSGDPGSLRVPISAHVDGLYGNHPSPALIIDVDDDLHLDWTTETVALRIVQEALANVARHAQASCIRIALAATDEGVVVVVADDGIGFDPSTTMFESGIATMRSFAAFTGGDVAIESAPGAGTTVTVVLRDGPASPGESAPGDGQVVAARVEADRSSGPAPHLRLVGGGTDADRSPAGSADR
jgi:signal transduction histidine kinase